MATPAENGNATGWNIPLIMLNGQPLDASIHEILQSLKSREMRADDIFLCSYPKSGIHWVWEILNMLVAGKVEYAKHWQNYSWLDTRTEQELEELPSPRVLHSQLYAETLPESIWRKKCKVVYLERDGKDCMVSRYCQTSNQVWKDDRLQAKKTTFSGTWDDFVNVFLAGGVAHGSWCDTVVNWNTFIDSHPERHIYKVLYTDLTKDSVREVKKLAEYLERPLPDSVYREIAEACSFSNLKHASEHVKDQTYHIRWAEGSSGYFRKGIVGDWKNWLTVAQSERFDRVYEEKLGKKTSD